MKPAGKMKDCVKNLSSCKNGLNIYQLNRIIYLIAGTCVGMICLCLTPMDFALKGFCQHYIPLLFLIPAGLILLSGLWEMTENISINTRKWVNGLSLLLLVIQISAVSQYYFYTDWDVTYLMDLSGRIAHHSSLSGHTAYFSQYPNNLLLAAVYAGVMRLMHTLGLHGSEYLSLLWFQCVLNTLTGLVVFRIIAELLDEQKAFWGFVIYSLLIGLSPWVSIPYSDSIGLILPSLILLIYVKREKFRHLLIPWLLIAFLSVLGYRIKPQIVIVFLAIVIVSIGTVKKDTCLQLVRRCIPGILTGMLCAVLLVNMLVCFTGVEVDEDRTFGLPHFFMMGLNTDTMGVWNAEDVFYSGQARTSEERSAADFERIRERMSEMGISGIAVQYTRKTLTNFYDGTFGWGQEGIFYNKIRKDPDNIVSRFFRNLYYNKEHMGNYYQAWSNFQQMLWWSVLTLGMIGTALKRKTEKEKELSVLLLSIVGLTLFVTLFEARARYLYLYVPFYIIAANIGISEIRRRRRAAKSEDVSQRFYAAEKTDEEGEETSGDFCVQRRSQNESAVSEAETF